MAFTLLKFRKKFLPKSWNFWSPLVLPGMLFSLTKRYYFCYNCYAFHMDYL
jgi:hypothetical protein